jgi:hypothetical protein
MLISVWPRGGVAVRCWLASKSSSSKRRWWMASVGSSTPESLAQNSGERNIAQVEGSESSIMQKTWSYRPAPRGAHPDGHPPPRQTHVPRCTPAINTCKREKAQEKPREVAMPHALQSAHGADRPPGRADSGVTGASGCAECAPWTQGGEERGGAGGRRRRRRPHPPPPLVPTARPAAHSHTVAVTCACPANQPAPSPLRQGPQSSGHLSWFFLCIFSLATVHG